MGPAEVRMSNPSVTAAAPRRRRSDAPWLGVYAASPERLVAACALSSKDERPAVQVAPVFDGPDPAALLLQWQRGHARRAQANVLLNSVDYRIVPVDAPRVPAGERREAVRWQLKELLDFPA